MAGREYFDETAVQPRHHLKKNYKMFANPVFITPGKYVFQFE